MSFSSTVKSELARVTPQGRHCRIAETLAIINMCGKIKETDSKLELKVQTENATLARKYFMLIKKTFNVDCAVSFRKNKQLKKAQTYILTVANDESVKKILRVLGIMRESGEVCNLSVPLIIQSGCCRRAYIRGAFLSGGSLSDPEKSYHLEFVCGNSRMAEQLRSTISTFSIDAKCIKRKGHYVVYLKEGEMIVDLMNVMGAHVALMDLENVRILKGMRNNVNRTVNCEAANINRVVSAAVKQLEDIQFIEKVAGIGILPDTLQEIAEIRLKHPEASLKELGELLTPIVGKSGVNHRLRKISEIACDMRLESRRYNND